MRRTRKGCPAYHAFSKREVRSCLTPAVVTLPICFPESGLTVRRGRMMNWSALLLGCLAGARHSREAPERERDLGGIQGRGGQRGVENLTKAMSWRNHIHLLKSMIGLEGIVHYLNDCLLEKWAWRIAECGTPGNSLLACEASPPPTPRLRDRRPRLQLWEPWPDSPFHDPPDARRTETGVLFSSRAARHRACGRFRR